MNQKLQNFLKYWLPVLFWFLIIFLFSSRSTITVSAIDWGDFFIKKTAHFSEYAILFTLLYRAIKQNQKLPLLKIAIWSLIITALYATSDEYHQSFIPGRTATVRDVMIDTSGGIFAWIILWKLLPKAPEKLKTWAKKLEIA